MDLLHYIPSFDEAYRRNAEWALANLTTWLVFATVLGAAVNAGVVWAAFRVQRNEFKTRENQEILDNTKFIDSYTLAIRSLIRALNIVRVYISSGNLSEYGTTQSIRRLTSLKRLVAHYEKLPRDDLFLTHVAIMAHEIGEHALSLLNVVQGNEKIKEITLLELTELAERSELLIPSLDSIRARFKLPGMPPIEKPEADPEPPAKDEA